MKDKKILGIITARGGSKGIPGKNIKALAGKPLIFYTIDAAQKSGVFDRIILSTDDQEISDVAKSYGCEVPFMRPKKLAEDGTPHLPVIQHAVEWLKEHEGYWPDYVMILQPTSPLRQPFHLKESVKLLDSGADTVLSVSKIPKQFSPYKAMVIHDDRFMRLINGDPVRNRAIRRQDLKDAYWSVGAIYLFKTGLIFDKDNPHFYGEKVAPYPIEAKYIVDIDEPEDWEVAEKAMKRIQEEEARSPISKLFNRLNKK